MSPIRRRTIKIVSLALLLSLLVISCSTEITAPTATVSKTATLNVTVVPFVSSTPENTPTAMLLPTPSPRPIAAWNLRVAYVTSQTINNMYTTQVWVLEPPYQMPRLLLTTAKANPLSNYVLAWSHDGRRIAFSHFITGQRMAISMIDIFSLQQQQLFSIAKQPYGSGSNAAVEVWQEAWSADDHWLAVSMRYYRTAGASEQEKTFIVSATDHQTFELEDNREFESWLPTPADHFVYLTHPQYPRRGNELVQIGRVGQAEPVSALADLGQYTPRRATDLSVSPDGNRALALSYESNIRTFISLLDLQRNESKLLPYSPKGIVSRPYRWSPNGEWLTFWVGTDIYFWEFNQASQPADIHLPLVDHISASIWAPDSSQLLYQDGLALYAVAPAAPQTPSLIVDLDALGIKSDESVSTNLWMPTLP